MYNYLNKKDKLFNLDIDLREQFDGLNKEFSHSLLYIRNCKYVRCDCFNEAHEAPDPNCKKCLGSGYFVSIQKIEGIERSRFSGTENTLTATELGMLDVGESSFYIKFDALPQNKDYILKVTWDKKGYPVDVVRACEVKNVHEVRGDNGRTELYKIMVKNRVDKVKLFDAAVKRLPKSAKSALGKGGTYIWPYKMLMN